jgi:hypothetical protein
LVLEDGSFYATAASISGTFNASEGKIGNLFIKEGGLSSGSTDNIDYTLNQEGLTFYTPYSSININNTKIGSEKINNENVTVIKTGDPLHLIGTNNTGIYI